MDIKRIEEMKKDGVKTFYIPSRAYYGKSLSYVDNKIYISYSAKDGGTYGEFGIDFIHLDNRDIPQLQIFNDGWLAFYLMPELLEALAEKDSQEISFQEIIDMLLGLGFKDDTSYKPEIVDDREKEQLIEKKNNLLRQVKEIDSMIEG